MYIKKRTILRILGFFVGLLSILFGISGGILLVPLLLLHFYYSKLEAISTSLILIIPLSFFSASLYFYQNTFPIEFSLICFILIGIIIGSHIGKKVLSKIRKSSLLFLFSLFLLLLSIKLLLSTNQNIVTLPTPTAILLGGVVGFLAVVLGIGGGILFVPLLHSFYGLTLEKSIATSLLIIPLTALIGLYSLNFKFYSRKYKKRTFYNNIIQLFIFSILGVLWGNFISFYLNEFFLSLLFSLFLIMYGMYLIYKTTLIYYIQRGLHIKYYNEIIKRIKYGKTRHIIKKGKKVHF
jgi:hypothetical protein